jgi:uncharacterized phage protein (TIGR01671 family)
MRWFEFRAWLKKEQKMISHDDIGYISFGNKIMMTMDDNMVFPEDYVLMRWTGLYDNAGRKIFEGDIVRIHDKGETKSPYLSVVTMSPYFGAKVDPHPAHKKMGLGQARDLYWYCSYGISEETECTCEIVGNTYENQELIFG